MRPMLVAIDGNAPTDAAEPVSVKRALLATDYDVDRLLEKPSKKEKQATMSFAMR